MLANFGICPYALGPAEAARGSRANPEQSCMLERLSCRRLRTQTSCVGREPPGSVAPSWGRLHRYSPGTATCRLMQLQHIPAFRFASRIANVTNRTARKQSTLFSRRTAGNVTHEPRYRCMVATTVVGVLASAGAVWSSPASVLAGPSGGAGEAWKCVAVARWLSDRRPS
jgi:hypothetical protein